MKFRTQGSIFSQAGNGSTAIRELEKIELIRQADRNYVLDHAVTATQKTILKAFDMDLLPFLHKCHLIYMQLMLKSGQ